MSERSSSYEVPLAPGAVALTIAGSDPSGGAGLQADLKTFQQLGVYGMSVVTLLTVQNTLGVRRVEVTDPELVAAQLDCVLEDIPPGAIKTGALGNAAVVRAVASKLQSLDCPLIVDPVMVSKHRDPLVTDDVVRAYAEHLLPLATLVTPNRFEAERLTGIPLESEAAAAEAVARLHEMGATYVLIKLGAVDGKREHLLGLENENLGLAVPDLPVRGTHGTGCILSAAITARLALGGVEMRQAIKFGIERTYEAISIDSRLGKGIHPAETRGMSRET